MSFVEISNYVTLILTYRKGAIVCVSTPAHINNTSSTATSLFHEILPILPNLNENCLYAEAWQVALAKQCILLWENLSLHTNFSISSVSSTMALAYSAESTAECLADMYQLSCEKLQTSDANINQIVVGIGPGSFTGIRIGCAFVDGLRTGRERYVGGVLGCSVKNLKQAFVNVSLSPLWQKEFDKLNESRNEAFSSIGLLDLILAIGLLNTVNLSCSQPLVPMYGQEPGPVLKLKNLNGGV